VLAQSPNHSHFTSYVVKYRSGYEMDTNRARQNQSYRPVMPPRQGRPIGGVRPPQPQRVSGMPPQPVHAAQPAQYIDQPALAPAQPQAVPRRHHVPAHPHHTATQTHHQPADDASTISIKLSIPEFRRPTVPPIMKEYPGFWWALAIGGLLLFTIGYQIGHSHAKPAVVSLLTSRERIA
jgi:hypothetical protein